MTPSLPAPPPQPEDGQIIKCCPFCGNSPDCDFDLETGALIECMECPVSPSVFVDNEPGDDALDNAQARAIESWNQREGCKL